MEKGQIFDFLVVNFTLPRSLFFMNLLSKELAYNWLLDLFGKKINLKKKTTIIYVQDVFTVQKGHTKCTVAQKVAHCPPFLVLVFDKALCVDTLRYT